MSRLTETESLPPTTLYPEDLKEIEAELREEDTEILISVSSQVREISSTYESIDSLLEDPLAPERITDYQLQFKNDNGKGVIYANSSDKDEHEARLHGDPEWRRETYKSINSVMSSNVNQWRSSFQQRELRIVNLFSTILTGFCFLQIIPTGPFYPAEQTLPIFSVLFAIFLTATIATGNRHDEFPYVTIYTVDNSELDRVESSWRDIIYLVILAWVFMWVLRRLWPFLPV